MRAWPLNRGPLIALIANDCALGDDAFQYLQRPLKIDGQRASALRFGDARAQAILNAVLMFVFVARGFTNKDLRRLRLHALIERLPKTHRYRLTEEGLRTALFYTRVYSRTLRPSMAPTLPTAPAGSLKVLRQYQAAEATVHSWCDHAHIAALKT